MTYNSDKSTGRLDELRYTSDKTIYNSDKSIEISDKYKDDSETPYR